MIEAGHGVRKLACALLWVSRLYKKEDYCATYSLLHGICVFAINDCQTPRIVKYSLKIAKMFIRIRISEMNCCRGICQ
jgi:hypothetical protein